MPFKTFTNWLFDGQKNSPIPRSEKVDILKYNSPIHHTFVIKLFLKHGPLNHYLDQYFNDINLRYLSKEELFRFIKKCVIDFKIRKSDLMYYKRQPKRALYDILREKIPHLKNDDIELLCEHIEMSDKKELIYESLGLEKPKKVKIKKEQKKKSGKVSLDEFLKEHFSMIEAT